MLSECLVGVTGCGVVWWSGADLLTHAEDYDLFFRARILIFSIFFFVIYVCISIYFYLHEQTDVLPFFYPFTLYLCLVSFVGILICMRLFHMFNISTASFRTYVHPPTCHPSIHPPIHACMRVPHTYAHPCLSARIAHHTACPYSGVHHFTCVWYVCIARGHTHDVHIWACMCVCVVFFGGVGGVLHVQMYGLHGQSYMYMQLCSCICKVHMTTPYAACIHTHHGGCRACIQVPHAVC